MNSMRRLSIRAFWLVAAAVMAASPLAVSAKNAPVNGSTIPMPAPLPDDYDVLNYRNIFYHGHLPLPHDSANAAPTKNPSVIEEREIFNGVTITNGECVAYLENTDAGTVRQLKIGDGIANGKITNITLGSLDYQSNGRTTHVQIGENLAGGAGWGMAPATTQPAPTDSQNMSTLDKLRLRRQQEMGGK